MPPIWISLNTSVLRMRPPAGRMALPAWFVDRTMETGE